MELYVDEMYFLVDLTVFYYYNAERNISNKNLLFDK